ncbi:MAG: tRNA pseudouridine synthase B [Candidatus Kapaibacterium sp.]|nr:MAG: tRNA pseudouridine synthase B [Candidatus Kapabacteria bacterium]GIV56270.1 MAG: tRNA pseudouridine synthase B [Candidatus Kapabacteria bacterium]
MIPLLSRNTDVRAWRERILLDGGAILVDKQQRWTSFDVVAKLRRLLGIKKIGHAGTLDPIATGLLIVCIGRATKQVDAFQALDKEYRVEIKLGARTESDDAETPEYKTTPIEHLEPQIIVTALDRFIGTFEQIPPTYSAVHVGGRRSYELARLGRTVSLPPRTVTVHAIEDVEIALPLVRLMVRCSKGTYIRALARDLGNVLGVGAYVTALRRTAIGNYRVEDALTIGELVTLLSEGNHADVPLHR